MILVIIDFIPNNHKWISDARTNSKHSTEGLKKLIFPPVPTERRIYMEHYKIKYMFNMSK